METQCYDGKRESRVCYIRYNIFQHLRYDFSV